MLQSLNERKWLQGVFMRVHFTKMQGLGNDYVFINCFKEKVFDPALLARKISDRHFGVGSDGLILIKPSNVADFAMEMYNADGSMGAMCGNGIRCFGKYVYDYRLTNQKKLAIETMSGIRKLELLSTREVKVDMGCPKLQPSEIGMRVSDKKIFIHESLTVDTTTYYVSCVSMGNPHCILFVDYLENLCIDAVGRQIENHPIFTDRTNVEFVQVVDRTHIKLRVWERGSGETLACGTGACAAMIACVLNGRTDTEVEVSLLGGKLFTSWNREEDTVYMTGPAETVFDGVIEL